MIPRIDSISDAGRAAVSAVDVALLEQLFDQATDMAFFVKDAQGRYTAVNQSLVERHGLKRKAEVLGKRTVDIGHGDFGRIPTEQDMHVLQTGRPLVDHLEMHWVRPHDPVWCLTTKLPLRDEAGAITGLIGFSRDVRVSIDAGEIPAEFAAALEEFERNLSPDVSPAWFAERCGMPPQRLTRLTKRLFGLTASQLITKTRIAAAARQLQETDASVADVAQACGFYDHSAFTRAFRSATGVTPKAYRNDERR